MTRYRKGALWLACAGAVIASAVALAGSEGEQWVSINTTDHAAAGDFGPVFTAVLDAKFGTACHHPLSGSRLRC